MAYGALFPGFLSLFVNLNRSHAKPRTALSRFWSTPETIEAGVQWSVHQMGTVSECECCSFIREMTIQQAVIYLYEKSMGKIILVAAKLNETVIINPTYHRTDDSLGPRSVISFFSLYFISLFVPTL